MALQGVEQLSPAQLAIVASAIAIAICISFFRSDQRTHLAKLAIIGATNEKWRQTYLETGRDIYLKGYQQFKNEVYRIITSDVETSLVVPPRFLPELRRAPDDVLSFPKSTENLLEAKYTNVLTSGPLAEAVIHVIKKDLTKNLARLNPAVCQEVDDATRAEFGSPTDWEKQWIYMKLCNIVAKASGRIIVGPEHCHEKEFLDHSINYTIDLMTAQQAIKKTRPWLRPYLAPRLAEVKRLRDRENKARVFLEPIVADRRKASQDPGYEKPEDMLQWFMNSAMNNVGSTENLAKAILSVLFAAIHTTSTTVTNMLYTLAAFPEYIPEIRQEIRNVMADNGGTITFLALQSMVKLDSFMKESTRFNPIGTTAFSRKVLKGFTLSNGQYLPSGTFIEAASSAIYLDEDIYHDSKTFDGFRFAKIRQNLPANESSRYLFVSTNERDLNFGYGAHACPGRFFASNEIKMLLARIILEYDVKNEDGRTGLEGRIQNISFGRSNSPDLTKPLMFRRAQD